MMWACEYSPRSLTKKGSVSDGGGLEDPVILLQRERERERLCCVWGI